MVSLEKSQAIFWYVAVPTSLRVLMFVGVAVDETSKPWDPLLIIKKRRPAPTDQLTAKSRPEDGRGSLTATDDYPRDFYDKAQVSDTLVFGFCHERLVRDGSIVAVSVGWFAVPFFLGAGAWFPLCVLLIAKPALLQRGSADVPRQSQRSAQPSKERSAKPDSCSEWQPIPGREPSPKPQRIQAGWSISSIVLAVLPAGRGMQSKGLDISIGSSCRFRSSSPRCFHAFTNRSTSH